MGEKGESSGTVEVVMDTPDRSKTQITAPMSKFEDSPVFNFLNSLSPIKPVKSLHITQTFNPLSFVSIPSVFTSPHVTSLKESRFLRRHQLGDPSKPEFASDNVNKDDTNEGIPASTEHQESFNPGSSTGEASVEPSYECQQFADEIVQSLNYDCSSPSSSRTPNRDLKTKLMSEVAGSSAGLVPYIQEESVKMFIGAEANAKGVSQTDQNKESAECDWGLISDAADLLIFDSPNDAEGFKKSMDPATRFYTSITNDVQSIHALVAVGSGEQLREESELEHQFTQPGDGNELEEFPETQDVNDSSSLGINCMAGGPVDSGDPENVCNLYRGMRRRCLVFELSGACRKHLHENSTSDCAMLPQPDGDTISSDKQLVLTKTGNESSRCVLPGIGLHLNALATTSKDYKVVKNEALASGRQLVIASGSAANFHMLNTGQESLSRTLDTTQSEREITPLETGVPVLEEGSQASGYVVNEEFNQNSPKKKRRRLENGEVEACKRCNCKKSKCLKLYCECFAAGVYCVEPCSCLDCFNKPIHEDTVLATRKQIESRNPLAFAPKVIRSNDPLSETGDDSSKTPASARHKRGCNCKKSGCLKKYCECYQGGVGCSINCRCEGCKNAFGRKDGSEPELEEEETDMGQKSVRDGSHPRSVIQCDAEQNPDYVPPATPLPFGGPPMQLPFASKNKPPRSSHLSVGSSSGLYTSQGFGKSNFFLPQPKFDKPFGTVEEDEMPEILQTNGSPISGVKSTSSPNSKRVSPPHVGPGMLSPGQRSSRKLILQSIPSFPSLTPKH